MRCALGAHLIGADRRCEHVFANTELNKTKNEIRQETKQALDLKMIATDNLMNKYKQSILYILLLKK